MNKKLNNSPFVIVLGVAQDGGVPHAGCKKKCCRNAWDDLSKRKYPSCLAIVDPKTKQRWLIDATPEFKYQLHSLHGISQVNSSPRIDGIFLTHGHIGHYAGLLELEKAIINSQNVPVFVMPKMKNFLEVNQPWQGLVTQGNIVLNDLVDGKKIDLNKNISIKPFLVPHRDEYTETVGFEIVGNNSKKVLYIPDIDKWKYWDKKIEEEVFRVDWALLDGTFFNQNEMPERDMSKIPHPFITESAKRFSGLSIDEKHKIFFTHLNHTNLAMIEGSRERREVIENGFNIAKEGDIFYIQFKLAMAGFFAKNEIAKKNCYDIFQ